jgi:NOL1/NOP2/sun family putative RNA methylase
MSGKQFFTDRYARLGWSYRDVKPRQALRINLSHTNQERLLERLRREGVLLDKVPFLDSGYWVRHSRVSVGATAEYLLGLYSIQEAAAQIPATVFSDLNGRLVLDACAAPGGKTVQIADLMKNTGVITALDVDRRRLSALSNHLERCRVRNTVVYCHDARLARRLKMRFDRILLDVPCSGNFAADKEWFARRTLRDVERNAEIQREILAEAEMCLKADGEIVYSTCSLEPEEDELNMEWAVKSLNLEIEDANCSGEKGLTNVFGQELDASVQRCRRIWPGETQGFFVCKLKKRGNSSD